MTNEACALASLEAVYLKMVEASPDAKIVIDTKGRIIVFNAQAELLFGRAREEVVGQEVEVLIPEAVRNDHVHHRTSYLAAPKTREMGTGQPLNGVDRDGNEFPVQIKLAPFTVAGRGKLVMAVVRRVGDTEPNQRGAS